MGTRTSPKTATRSGRNTVSFDTARTLALALPGVEEYL